MRALLGLVCLCAAALPSRAAALEYCFLDPVGGGCIPAYRCPPEGCPTGWVCEELGYGYTECALADRVDCCHIPTGGHCNPGDVCVRHHDAYGACLPWRSAIDAAACEELLDLGGGRACAAHDCDGDGVADSMDSCVCIAGPQVDADGDGIGDACDPDPTVATDAGPPPTPDAGPVVDAGPDPRLMPDGGPDAGSDRAHTSWGCDCRVGSTAAGRSFGLGVLLPAALLLCGVCRRRRGG